MRVTDETSEDSKENGDSCVGDTPDIVYAMKPLTQTKEPLDSDEEDAAILIAAANGNLSPIEASITARPAKAKNRTRKRSRVLRGTSGLADIKSRAAKKATNFTPKLGARKTKAAKKKVQQLHLTKPPKKKQLKGYVTLSVCGRKAAFSNRINLRFIYIAECQRSRTSYYVAFNSLEAITSFSVKLLV